MNLNFENLLIKMRVDEKLKSNILNTTFRVLRNNRFYCYGVILIRIP